MNPSPGQLPATSVVVDGGSAGGDHLLGKTSGPLFSDKIPYSFCALQVFTRHLRKCALGAAKKKTIPVRVYINTIPINKSLRNHRMQSTSIPIRFPSARTAAGSRVPTGRRARVLTRIHIPALRAPPRNGAPTRPDICWCTTRRLCSLSPRAGAGPRRRRREGTFVRWMSRAVGSPWVPFDLVPAESSSDRSLRRRTCG